MKKFEGREISGIALITAGLVVVGFIVYFFSGFFPFPGSKFLLLALVMGFSFTLLLHRYPRRGSFFASALVLGAVMMIISPVMAAAIWLAGLLTEITIRFLGGYDCEEKNCPFFAAMFPGVSWITFLLVSQLLLGIDIFRWLNLPLILLITILIYILGYLGGRLYHKVFPRELKGESEIEPRKYRLVF